MSVPVLLYVGELCSVKAAGFLKGKQNWRHKVTRKQKMCKHFSLQTLFGCSVNMYVFFLLQIWVQLRSIILCEWRAEKGWIVMYLLLLPHMMALFMMSLSDAAGHKMATLAVVFSWFSDKFNKQGQWIEWTTLKNKNKTLYVCLLFHSGGCGLWCFFASVPL